MSSLSYSTMSKEQLIQEINRFRTLRKRKEKKYSKKSVKALNEIVLKEKAKYYDFVVKPFKGYGFQTKNNLWKEVKRLRVEQGREESYKGEYKYKTVLKLTEELIFLRDVKAIEEETEDIDVSDVKVNINDVTYPIDELIEMELPDYMRISVSDEEIDSAVMAVGSNYPNVESIVRSRILGNIYVAIRANQPENKLIFINFNGTYRTLNDRFFDQVFDEMFINSIASEFNQQQGSDSDQMISMVRGSIDFIAEYRSRESIQREQNEGGFLPFYIATTNKNELGEDFKFNQLKKFQICYRRISDTDEKFYKRVAEMNEINCFVNSLKEKFPDYSYKKIIPLIQARELTNTDVSNICKLIKFKALVYKRGPKNNCSTLGLKTNFKKTLHMELYERHYMPRLKIKVGDELMYPSDFLEYCKELGIAYYYDQSHILKMKQFNKIDVDDAALFKYQYENHEYKEKKKEPCVREIIFADFETYKNKNDFHEAYMLCYADDEKTYDFIGSKCARKFLNHIKEKYNGCDDVEVVCYFHNLGYDINFILNSGYKFNCKSILKEGNNIYECVLQLSSSVRIKFRDSYKQISAPLRKFKGMFNLDVAKEIFPYNVVNNKVVKLYSLKFGGKKTIPLQTALDDLKPSEHKDFIDMAKDFIKGNKIDIIGYALKYCRKDVEVLQKGFNIHKANLLEMTKLDIEDFITSSSIAKKYYDMNGALDGVIKCQGGLAILMDKFVRGGRVCLKNNKKFKIDCTNTDKIITDLDANSLYPTAVVQLCERFYGLPTGKLYYIDAEKCSFEELIAKDNIKYWFAKVKCINVKNHMTIPSFAKIVNNKLIWSSDLKYETMYINNIDYISARDREGLEFELEWALYTTEDGNKKAGEITKYLYEQRSIVRKKSEGLGNICKLIMNSFYGKTIQKVKFTKNVIKKADDMKKYITRNYNNIKSYELFNDDNNALFNCYNNVLNQDNFALVGTLILSMSKLIMNECIDKVTDMGFDVIYTDTDSIQGVLTEDILAKIKADESMYGSGLGKFKVDYAGGVNGTKGIWIAKKCYMTALNNGDLHFRMKGIPNSAFNKQDGEKIYLDLFEGKKVKFDLCKYKPMFQKNGGFTIKQLDKFERDISFKDDEIVKTKVNNVDSMIKKTDFKQLEIFNKIN